MEPTTPSAGILFLISGLWAFCSLLAMIYSSSQLNNEHTDPADVYKLVKSFQTSSNHFIFSFLALIFLLIFNSLS